MEGHGKRENRTYSHHQDSCLFNVLPASLLMEKDVDLLMGIKRVKLLLLIFYTTTAKISPPIPPRSKHFYIHHVILVSCVFISRCAVCIQRFFFVPIYKKKSLIVYVPTDATHCSVALLFTSLCDLLLVFPCEDVCC